MRYKYMLYVDQIYINEYSSLKKARFNGDLYLDCRPFTKSYVVIRRPACEPWFFFHGQCVYASEGRAV